MFVLYNLLLTLLSPLWAPWMLKRALMRKEAPNWRERQGDYEVERRKDRKRVWVHAVSVGEVMAATPVLRELRIVLPDHEILLSTTTSSGHRTAREQEPGLFDHLVYFPIDVARFQLAAMSRVQPAVVAIMETELWMNFLWAAKTFDAGTLLINGRVSERSLARARLAKPFYRAMLGQVDRCLMQSEADAARIRELGASNAEVVGNTKFDQALQGLDSDPAFWRSELGLPKEAPVVVVGSTRGEEEERFVIEALKEVSIGEVAVVHAPRHLERVPALTKLYEAAGFQPRLRSQGGGGAVVLLDTYGELDRVYAVADLAVVGGGFENLGGQNLLQPLAHGKPVLHGPHMQNFREVANMAVAAGASRVVATPQELAEAMKSLLGDAQARARMGSAARELIERSSGAARRYAEAIAEAAAAFHALAEANPSRSKDASAR